MRTSTWWNLSKFEMPSRTPMQTTQHPSRRVYVDQDPHLRGQNERVCPETTAYLEHIQSFGRTALESNNLLTILKSASPWSLDM